MIRRAIIKLRITGYNEYDATHLLVEGSLAFNLQLFGPEKKSTIDTVSFQLKHDDTLTARIRAASARIGISITDAQTGDALFTGVIEPNAEQSTAQVVGPVSLQAVDMSYLLDKPIAQSFHFPPSIGDSGYKIFDPSDQAKSIVHLVASLAGYTAQDFVTSGTVLDVVPYCAATAGDETYREFLDTLLFEYRQVLHSDALGRLYLARWTREDSLTDLEIGTGTPHALSTIEPLLWSKKANYKDGAKVEWSETQVVESALVYRDSLPVTADGVFEGQAIAAGDYYPSDSDIEETYQDFVTQWLDTPYLARQSRLRNVDLTLVTTSNQEIIYQADPGIIIDLEEYETHRARIRFRNTGAATARIYSFEIHARAIIRPAIKKCLCPSTSANPASYTSRFLFGALPAMALANALALDTLYGDYEYTFGLNDPISLGLVAHLVDVKSGTDTRAMVYALSFTVGRPIIKYKAVALAEWYEEGKQNISGKPSKLDSTAAMQAILLRPTYTELISGFTSGGGTTTPIAPVISATSGFRSIFINIDKQANLTCFGHYEIQVAELAAGPWFAPRLDGSDWKAGSDGAASATVEIFIHANIPLAGTAEAPLARTLYYRACRVTKGGIKSGWSNVVSAAAVATSTGDIAENSITANKLAVGILSAIIAQISDHLVIDSEVGFAGGDTGETEGNERAYLNESGIAFERFANGVWGALAKLSRIGLQTPQVFSTGALTVGNGTNKTRRANGFDLGIPYPSANTHVCHFDDDYTDQNGVPYWTLGGNYALDVQEFAILSMAPFSVSGGSLSGVTVITRDGGTALFGSWWLDFFFVFSVMTGAGVICKVGNASTYVQLSIQQTSGMEYTALGNGESFAYVDVDGTGQKAYIAAVIQKQLIVVIVRNGAQESANYTLGDLSGWAHIALGVDASTGYLNGLINIGEVEVTISRSAFNQGGSAAMSLSINTEQSYTCKVDELMLDLSMPINTAMAAAQTKSRIPWAKNDYNSRKFFLDAYDDVVMPKATIQGTLAAGALNLLNPDSSDQNLVRSGYVAGKGWWTKFPDGTLICRYITTGMPNYQGVTGGVYFTFPEGWTFPMPFVGDVPSISLNTTSNTSFPAWMMGTGTSLITTSYHYCTNGGPIGAGQAITARATLMAVGRWKA